MRQQTQENGRSETEENTTEGKRRHTSRQLCARTASGAARGNGCPEAAKNQRAESYLQGRDNVIIPFSSCTRRWTGQPSREWQHGLPSSREQSSAICHCQCVPPHTHTHTPSLAWELIRAYQHGRGGAGGEGLYPFAMSLPLQFGSVEKVLTVTIKIRKQQ